MKFEIQIQDEKKDQEEAEIAWECYAAADNHQDAVDSYAATKKRAAKRDPGEARRNVRLVLILDEPNAFCLLVILDTHTNF